MHRVLQRQLKRIAGIADDAALAAALQEMGRLADADGLSPGAKALLAGLGELMGRVDGAYEQYERDLALRTRSLELSSEELSMANDQLRADLASRSRAETALRESVAGLLFAEAEGEAAASLAGNDLESLAVLVARLIEKREAERRELDNQKFALDQHAIVSITDTQGVILYANDRFCEISGYAREELIGQPHRIVRSGLHPASVFAEMWQTISSGRVWHGEICNRRKSGEHYWVSATIVPFLDKEGLPTRYIGIRTDITERKAIEARLGEQLRFVEELIEAIPLPLYLKDAGGRYQRVNKAFERFFAVERSDVLGKTVQDLLRPEEVALHAAKDAELYRAAGSQTYEARVTSRDGVVRDTIYRKAALTYLEGGISGLLGTIIDITDRKRAEEALHGAMLAAEAANRAKSDFLANMSHEIRTPMNGVIGMTELALGCALDDEPREYLQIVKSSAESLLTVINDILDFSKIEAGKMQIERISFHLPRLFSEAVKPLALRAHEKNLELVLDLDASLPEFVVGDPGRLRQILINLAGNAIKFTESGEVVIKVSPGASADLVRCTVRDTGIGIPEDKITTIFEAFAQEDSSTTRRFGGTGLGLTISTRLVGMMGGRLEVESTPGQGSSFSFELPLPADGSRQLSSDPMTNLAGKRVLLVDDNATNRTVLSKMFVRWGMPVTACASATEVFARLDECRPQLIVLDGHMPVIDGFELAGRLREDVRTMSVPKIMLSSGAMPGDGERCRELGLVAYFSKPVVEQELLASLHVVLGQGQARRPDSLVTRHTLRESSEALDILLVEDHPINQKLAVSLLERWGHRVSLAGNGQEALDQVAGHTFDLILMDLQMPVMGGLEATQRLRLAGCRTRIVAMTANAMEGDRELCLDAGMDDYIAKPIKADELFTLLRRSAPESALSPGDDDSGFDYAAALASADPEILEVIAPLFVEACPDDLAALRNGLADGDTDHARRHAHTLRGLAATFLAAPAVRQARMIEDALGRNDLAAAQTALPHLEVALAALVDALRESGQVR